MQKNPSCLSVYLNGVLMCCDTKVTKHYSDASSSVSLRWNNQNTHTHTCSLDLCKLCYVQLSIIIVIINVSFMLPSCPRSPRFCQINSCVITLMETDTGVSYRQSYMSHRSLLATAKACVITRLTPLVFLFIPASVVKPLAITIL